MSRGAFVRLKTNERMIDHLNIHTSILHKVTIQNRNLFFYYYYYLFVCFVFLLQEIFQIASVSWLTGGEMQRV